MSCSTASPPRSGLPMPQPSKPHSMRARASTRLWTVDTVPPPLHLACQVLARKARAYNDPRPAHAVIALLLAVGVDPWARDADGLTPMAYAEGLSAPTLAARIAAETEARGPLPRRFHRCTNRAQPEQGRQRCSAAGRNRAVHPAVFGRGGTIYDCSGIPAAAPARAEFHPLTPTLGV